MAVRSFVLGSVVLDNTTYKAVIDTTDVQLASPQPEYTAFYVLVDKGSQPPTLQTERDAQFRKTSTPTVENENGTDVSGDYDAYVCSGDIQPTVSYGGVTLKPASNLTGLGLTLIDSLPVFTIGYAGEEATIAITAMAKVLAERTMPLDLTAGSLSVYRGGVYMLDSNFGDTHTVHAFTKEGDNFVLKEEITNLRRKQRTIAPEESFSAGDVDMDGETVFYVVGVSNLANRQRIVTYFTGDPTKTLGVALRKTTTRAARLDDLPESTQSETKIPDLANDDTLPSTERRTRAQLYAALVAAERSGDRTIRSSALEKEIRSAGYYSFARGRSLEAAKELSQGELISLVSALANEAYNDRLEYESRLSRQQVSHTGGIINIIVGGYGYDHQ